MLECWKVDWESGRRRNAARRAFVTLLSNIVLDVGPRVRATPSSVCAMQTVATFTCAANEPVSE